MPDVVQRVTKQGYFSRLAGSFKGIFIGLLLFLVSFGVLFWNEGRVDLSNIARDAAPISSEQVNADAEVNGTLVSTSGKLTTEEELGDGMYLQPGEYLELNRDVEVYAWVENSSSTSKTNVGGSETTETTYTYQKEWVSEAPDSASFEEPTGHQNVAKAIEEQTFTAGSAKVGVYSIDMDSLTLPGSSQVTLSAENTTGVKVVEEEAKPDVEANEDPFFDDEEFFDEDDFFDDTPTTTKNNKPILVGNMYIYQGSGSLTSPQVGDMRISYKAVANNADGTLFGRLDGDKVTSYTDKDNNRIYRFFIGSADDAVATLHTEYTTMLWIFRLLGFLMMWIGLMMVLAPVGVLLDLLPFLGSLSRSAIKFATFIISVALSVVAILVSMILHSILALIVVALLGAGFTYWFLKMKGNKAGPPPSKEEPAASE